MQEVSGSAKWKIGQRSSQLLENETRHRRLRAQIARDTGPQRRNSSSEDHSRLLTVPAGSEAVESGLAEQSASLEGQNCHE